MNPAKKNQFLTEKEEQDIVQAIQKAEKETSGEIRVHIENKCKKDPLLRAQKVFADLQMQKTELKNGVLVYIASDDHKVAVFGGKAIHDTVGKTFWDDILADMIDDFKKGSFKSGIEKAVLSIGDKLKSHFPYKSDDKDELSNDISFNENS